MTYYSFSDVDVSQWIGPTRPRLTFHDVCIELGIDVKDKIIRYLMDIDLLSERVIDEPHLDMMGLRGKTYEEKQKQFLKLLKANPDISYSRRKNYYIVRGWDFETLFAQVEGEAGDAFRQKSKHLCYAYKKYWEYRDMYNKLKSSNV